MKDLFKLTIILTVICSVAATALALVYNITKEPIAYQQRLKKLKAIKAVQPNYDNEPDRDFVDVAPGEGNPTRFYLTKKGGEYTGAVFIVTATGYGGPIELMVGIDPAGTITGVQILKHSETPGLGAKITEEGFIKQFSSKNIHNTKWALKKDGGEIDQISGATISPRAVVKALNEGLTFFSEHKKEIFKTGWGKKEGA